MVNEEQASRDASSAGLCPGLTANAMISRFLLLLEHQMRNSVIAARVACLTHRQSWRLGDVATHLWALESGMNLAFRPQSHALLSASDRARAFPAPVSSGYGKETQLPMRSFQASGRFSRNAPGQGLPPSEVLRVESSHFPLLAHAHSSSEQTGR